MYNYARGLISRGHRLRVITTVPHYPHGNIPRKYLAKVTTASTFHSVPLIRLWMPPLRSVGAVRRSILLSAFSVLSFFALFAVRNPDIVYGAGSISPSPFDIPILLHCRLRRLPFVLIENDSLPETLQASSPVLNRFFKLLRGISLWVEKNVSGITTYTESIKRIILARGTDGRKVHIIPLPVDVDIFSPTEIRQPRSKIVAVYSGNIGVLYDFDLLLKCANLLRNEVLFIIRGDGELKSSLYRTLGRLGIDNVTILGKVENYSQVAEVLDTADIAVVPMKNIPVWVDVAVPTKIFEFIAMGKPVVCSGGGECRKLIEGHQVGLVAQPEDYVEMARMISTLARDELTRKAMGERGRRLALKEFSTARVAEKLEAVLAGIVRNEPMKTTAVGAPRITIDA